MALYSGTTTHSIHSKNIGQSILYGVLGLICLVLFFLNLYISFYDIEIKTISFADLFTELSQIDAINTDGVKFAFQSGISEDWGVFNFLRDFINGLWQIIGVVSYVCVSIANACVYLFNVLRVVFVGVLG